MQDFYITDLKAYLDMDCLGGHYFSSIDKTIDLYLNGELLTDVIIPNGVTVLNSIALSNEHITSVTIPQSVASISAFAFSGSTNLHSITVLCDPPENITAVFAKYLADIYYPCSNPKWDEMERNAWSTTANWIPLHNWNKPTYKWTTDNLLVSANCSCKDDSSHEETETVKTTSAVTKAATYTTMGQTTYTASFTNPEFKTQTKVVTNVPKLAKKVNPITVKTKAITVKYKKVKKKNQTIEAKNAFVVSKAKGKVTYKKSSGNSKITISSAGKITIKKKLKKGTYKVKVVVTAAGTTQYKAGSKTVTLTIKVK